MTPVWDRKPNHLAGVGGAGAGASPLDGVSGAHAIPVSDGSVGGAVGGGVGVVRAHAAATAGQSSGGGSSVPAGNSDRAITSEAMSPMAGAGGAGALPAASSTAAVSGVSPRLGAASGSAGGQSAGISRGTADASHAGGVPERAKLAWADAGLSVSPGATAANSGERGEGRIATAPSPADASAGGSSIAAMPRLAYFIGVQFEVRGCDRCQQTGMACRHVHERY